MKKKLCILELKLKDEGGEIYMEQTNTYAHLFWSLPAYIARHNNYRGILIIQIVWE